MGTILIGLVVVIAIVVAARCRKLKYFNIGYRPVYGTEFCRARLVGKVDRPDNKALYVVEIHPKDAAKAYAWAVPETKLYEGHLLEKGKFYKLAFKEELYERTKATP